MRSRKMTIRRRRPGFGAKHKKRVVKKSAKKPKLTKALKTQAKKHGVRVRLRRNGKLVEKSEKMLKKQIMAAKKRKEMKKKKMTMKKKAKKTVRKVKRKTRKAPKRKAPNRRVKSKFGKLEVPAGMKSVSQMRDQARFLGREHRPLLIAPHGPPQPWLLKDETPAYSGAPSYGRRRKRRTRRNYGFGNSLAGKRVNPSGYLSTWYGFPRTAPPSWNPLLLQGGNNFREGVNDPTLSNVGTAFGKRKVKRKTSKKKTVPASLKKMAKKHNVKLTVKKGTKRVPKSEKELRRQVSNKMKTKKSAPKRRVKRKTRKAPKRRVKRRR